MIREYLRDWKTAWNRFWFSTADPIVLGVMRVLVASILFYTHLVWTLELETFFGDQAVVPETYRYFLFDQSSWTWSHFDWISGGAAMWIVHWLGLFVVLLWLVGWKTRWTGWQAGLLADFIRQPRYRAQFGLDQINGFLCLYLAIGNCGASFSVDRWLANRVGRTRGRAGGGKIAVDQSGLASRREVQYSDSFDSSSYVRRLPVCGSWENFKARVGGMVKRFGERSPALSTKRSI